jgi:hypothetical protein
MAISFSTFSQSLTPEVLIKNKDSLFCFTIPQSKKIAKLITKAEYSDSLAQAKESEAEELAQIATRMQHNIELLQKVNEDYRKEIALSEGQTVDCEKEKEIIVKSERKDKFRKALITFLIGCAVGGFATSLHF